MFTIPELKARRLPSQSQGHRCPHCGAGLWRNLPIVVATRNCPGCGRRVVEEPDHDNAPPPFTHQQIEAEQAAHARALGRIGWVMATTFLAWFAVIVVIALYRDTIREAVRPFIDPQWIAVLIPLPLVAAGVAAALILIRADRIAPTRCPFCTTRLHRLYGTLVWISGNCWGCGRHVVIPASVEEAAGPLPSVEAFKESFARVRRAGTIAGAILCGLFLTVYLVLAIVVSRAEGLWQSLEDRGGPVYAGLVASALSAAVVLAAAGILILGSRLLLRWHRKRWEADPVLSCLHCQAVLSPTAQVIASKRCPRCRRRVLAEPESSGIATDVPAG